MAWNRKPPVMPQAIRDGEWKDLVFCDELADVAFEIGSV
jgi:hypothetical protein